MMISRALQYPFQGNGWFKRILVLALVQLIPIVGQLALLGYGLDIVRAIYAGQTDLPPVHWMSALRDGAKVAFAGLLYLVPFLMAVPLLSSGGSASALRLPLLVVLSLIVAPLGSRLRKNGGKAQKIIGALFALIPIIVISVSVLSLLAARTGANTANTQPTATTNGIGGPLFIIVSIVIFIVLMGMLVGAVRLAIENKGLFDPTRNARLLIRQRGFTRLLLLNSALLIVITTAITMLGFVLLIVPGLFVFVTGALALWYLLAQFGMHAGIQRPA